MKLCNLTPERPACINSVGENSQTAVCAAPEHWHIAG